VQASHHTIELSRLVGNFRFVGNTEITTPVSRNFRIAANTAARNLDASL
jgi:hypothetical protein